MICLFFCWLKKKKWKNNFVLLFRKIRMNDALFWWWNTEISIGCYRSKSTKFDSNNGHMNNNNQSTERHSQYHCVIINYCLSALHPIVVICGLCIWNWILFILQWTTKVMSERINVFYERVDFVTMVVVSWKPSSGWWRPE